MQKISKTRRQELVLEGNLHFPLTLLDSERFRGWRQGCGCPSGVEASHCGGMVTIETDLDWSMHYSDRLGSDHKPPAALKEAPGFCIDGLFYVPSSAFEMEGFREWVHSDWFPEKVRATFIDGTVEVRMSPEEQESHGKLTVELIAELRRLVKRQRSGDLFAEATTVVCPAAELSSEPDIVFCSWDAYRSGRVRQHERREGSDRFVELVGAPDMVAEVVSQNSVKKDRRILRRKYWQAGISEYWLMDARGKKPIRFELLTRGEEDYEPVEPDDNGYRYSPAFQRRFKIVRRVNPVGRYDYRLLQRKQEGT